MASILSKFWNMIGLGDEEELEDDYEEESAIVQPAVPLEKKSEGVRILSKAGNPVHTPTVSSTNPSSPTTANSSPINNVVPMPPKGNTMMNGNENSRLVVYAPNRFEEVQILVDHMKADRPVIVSLEGLDGDLARSMLDFICGATYALEGSMQKISGNIFLVAPRDVDVSSNLKEALLARDSLVRKHDDKGEI